MFMKRCLASFALIGLVNAQSQPAFEVASIKPADPSSPVLSGTRSSPGRFAGTGTLQTFLRLAYDVEGFQISGGPNWLDSARFDIEAKAECSFQ
jgi:uncharacterized protein (TIGR03435 family)